MPTLYDLKPKYLLRHFETDVEATDWLNEMDDQGYVLECLSSCEVQSGRDKRLRDVQITVAVRFVIKTALPPPAPVAPAPLFGSLMTPPYYPAT